ENDVVLADAQAPGVVVAGADKFQGRSVRFESENPLAKPDLSATHRATEYGITDRPPNPVVESVAQIARCRVGIARSPAGEQHPSFVRLVVPVRVPEKLR